MNKKGYTLVELLATLIVLSIVIGITIPIALNVINNSKEKDLELIKKNISDAAVNLVNECNFDDSFEDSFSTSNRICPALSTDGKKLISVRDLMKRGFLSNYEGEYGSYVIKNPVNGENIADCHFYVLDDGTVCSGIKDTGCTFFKLCSWVEG